MQEAIKASGRVPQNKARSQRSAGPSEVRKFIRMYKAGHTMYRIAVLCKRDPATVRWALIREGVRQA